MRWVWLRFAFYGVALALLSLRLFGGSDADAGDVSKKREPFRSLRADAGPTGDIRIGTRGDDVLQVSVDAPVACDRGGAEEAWFWFSREDIAQSGPKFTGDGWQQYADAGGVATYTYWFSGELDEDGEAATGSARIWVDVENARGRTTRTCDSGELAWQVR